MWNGTTGVAIDNLISRALFAMRFGDLNMLISNQLTSDSQILFRRAISERNPDKVGLRTLGTDFELISEQRARDLRPSTMVVLPWYFKKEIVDREQDYLRQGGKLLFPMPYAHVVTKDREITL